MSDANEQQKSIDALAEEVNDLARRGDRRGAVRAMAALRAALAAPEAQAPVGGEGS